MVLKEARSLTEIYLFVNPLGKYCLETEKKFLTLISNEKEKVHFRLIPILNPKVLQHYIVQHHLPQKDLDYRNDLNNAIYSACLDVKTVQLQGRHLSRKFILSLQQQVGNLGKTYSNDLVLDILSDIGANVEDFKADRQTKLVVDFFKLDQQMSHEMNIERFSDAVIFNYHSDRDFGVLVTDNISQGDIQALLKTDYKHKVNRFNFKNQLHN